MNTGTQIDIAMAGMAEPLSTALTVFAIVALLTGAVLLAMGKTKALPQVAMVVVGCMIGVGAFGISDTIAGTARDISVAAVDAWDFFTGERF